MNTTSLSSVNSFESKSLRQRRVKDQGQDNVLSSKIFTTSTDFSPSHYSSVTKKSSLPHQSMSSSFVEPNASPNAHFSSPTRGLPRNSLLTATESDYINRQSYANQSRRDEFLDHTPSQPQPPHHSRFGDTLTQSRDLIPQREDRVALQQQDFTPLTRPTTTGAPSYISREDIHEGSIHNPSRTQHQMHSSQPLASNTLDKLTGLAERTPLSAEVSLWPHWVVVFGFNPHADRDSPSSLHNILRLFQEFGEIDDYSAGAGNWLFIRFVSSHDADRVLSLDNTFLTSHLMIGVRKLNPKMAREMNLSVRSDGRLSQGEGVINRESLAGAAYRRELDPDFDSIMKPPKKSKDICTRIFEFFMAY